ncbi:MAG TPA: TIGR03066 family protein [Gemmataceae bacterium]|nr:TIGR03066 family protein [Gemmataceae bacterium]
MRTLQVAALSCLVLGLAAVSHAGAQNADKKAPNKENLVGVWDVTKSEEAPKGATIEFTRDGKVIISIPQEGKAIKFEGTYTVEGNKITTAIKFGDKVKKETVTIKELSDTKLVTVDEKSKVEEFKKRPKK